MNIKSAKEQVKYAVTSYLAKDAFGRYRIPIERQRPLFLVGPPGIGKTDIMAQVASEMDIALVSYSMTHHTRQSALGLPFIQNRDFAGQEYRTTEYTMSEIIASVYDVMEKTGKREGILFLDEINCISETLAPSMLQFLQYKTFGRHGVPEGWVVVTAGNPPEYNDSVREFDLVTLDRLKVVDVEPDFDVWLEYAREEGIHTAVLTYLEIKKDDFYKVETTIDGKSFVTARGWVDLSNMISLHEENDFPVTLDLVKQYIHEDRIARGFSAYYDLTFRYNRDYRIADMLDGADMSDVFARARLSRFDERLTVLRLITDALGNDFRDSFVIGHTIQQLLAVIKTNKEVLMSADAAGTCDIILNIRDKRRISFSKRSRAKSVSKDETIVEFKLDAFLAELQEYVTSHSHDEAYSTDDTIRGFIGEKNAARKNLADRIAERLENAFRFIKEVYTEEREMLIFVTSLTENKYSAEYIGIYGSESYFKYNKKLMLYEREKELAEEIRDANEQQ